MATPTYQKFVLPLEIVERQLADFVDEVIDRTKLLKHYHKAGYQNDAKVNLVGHSMGGVVITGYLERTGKQAPVAKVARSYPFILAATGAGASFPAFQT